MGFFSRSTPASAPAPVDPSASTADHEGPAITEPIPAPKPGTSLPEPLPPLDQTQQHKVDQIIDHLNQPHYIAPTRPKHLKHFWKHKATGTHGKEPTDPKLVEELSLQPLSEQEKCWLTNEQIQRCCRAVKWDLKKAIERIEETLAWRREFGVTELKAKDVAVEGETGKEYVYGYDKQSRPIHYMHPDRQNTELSPRQIQWVVYTLERTVDLMPPGVEKLCLCIDFGAASGGGQPTSIGQGREVLKILQTYYCERLGRAICVNVPTVFWAFYKLMGPFIDPVTKDKIRFIREPSEARELIDEEHATTVAFGGKTDVAYKHHYEYLAKLEALCAQRRAEQFERWQTLCGAKIGASEWVIKGGDAASTGAAEIEESGVATESTSPAVTSPDAAEESLPAAVEAVDLNKN